MTKNYDFDLDDPLGDLLSDDSANEFFDENFKGKNTKSLVERAQDKTKIISDLFGIPGQKDQNAGVNQIEKEKKAETPITKRDIDSPPPIIASNKSKASWLDFASSNRSIEDTYKPKHKQDIFDNDSILDDLLGK